MTDRAAETITTLEALITELQERIDADHHDICQRCDERRSQIAALTSAIAALKAQAGSCETCKFAGASFDATRECWIRDQFHILTTLRNMVPLTINGQPFSCAGYTAKETT